MIEVCTGAESMGPARPPKPAQITRILSQLGHVRCSIHLPILSAWTYRTVLREKYLR